MCSPAFWAHYHRPWIQSGIQQQYQSMPAALTPTLCCCCCCTDSQAGVCGLIRGAVRNSTAAAWCLLGSAKLEERNTGNSHSIQNPERQCSCSGRKLFTYDFRHFYSYKHPVSPLWTWRTTGVRWEHRHANRPLQSKTRFRGFLPFLLLFVHNLLTYHYRMSGFKMCRDGRS